MSLITHPDLLQKVIDDIDTLSEARRRQQERYEKLNAQGQSTYTDPFIQQQTPINDLIEDRKKDAERWEENARILHDILNAAY